MLFPHQPLSKKSLSPRERSPLDRGACGAFVRCHCCSVQYRARGYPYHHGDGTHLDADEQHGQHLDVEVGLGTETGFSKNWVSSAEQ